MDGQARFFGAYKKGTSVGAFEPMEHSVAHKRLERLMTTFGLCYLLTQIGGKAIAADFLNAAITLFDQVGGAALPHTLLQLFAPQVTDSRTNQGSNRAASGTT